MVASSWCFDFTREMAHPGGRVAERRRGVLPSRAVIPDSPSLHGCRGERLIVAVG